MEHVRLSKVTHLNIALDIISDLNASEWYHKRLKEELGKITAKCNRVIIGLLDNYQYQYEYNCIDALKSELISVKDICCPCKDRKCEICDLYHYDDCCLEDHEQFFCFRDCSNCTKLKEAILNLSEELTLEEILSLLKMEYCDHDFDFETGQLEEGENIDKIRDIIKDKWVPYVNSLSS